MISRRQLAALDLVGPGDIAERVGVKGHTIATWRARFSDFPRPELTIARVPLWRWERVKPWLETHGRTLEVRTGEVSAQDLATAIQLLPKVRDQLKREVRAAADAVADLLSEPLHRPPARDKVRNGRGQYGSNDGRGNGRGEWDWYAQVSNAERERLQAWFSSSPSAGGPDQYADALEHRLGSRTIDEAMSEWLNATRLADAAKMLERGQVPPFSFDALTSYNVAAIFSDEGALELARAWALEREAMGDYVPPTVELVDEEVF